VLAILATDSTVLGRLRWSILKQMAGIRVPYCHLAQSSAGDSMILDNLVLVELSISLHPLMLSASRLVLLALLLAFRTHAS
jgi:hypothetical protein